MTQAEARKVILVIEDGDEYLQSLSRSVAGPTYLQAHSCAEAIALLEQQKVELLYLDMRFDRISRTALVGDHASATTEQGGDAERGWRYLQDNQGLFILDALNRAGWGHLPVILAHDFTHQPRRLAHLKKLYPKLEWVPDAVSHQQVRALLEKAR